jgi:acetyl-CoA carboxylase biotin carboxyl carrier protein
MDINLLKKLIKMVEQSEVTEFSVQEGDLKVRISKNSHQSVNIQHQPYVEYSKPVPFSNPIKQALPNSTSQSVDHSSSKYHEIKSPIVGTFYSSPAPDADPYVRIGDSVSTGSVLCIVEAMKLMNEIECDISGKIVKILVDNATPVEYNQPLFLIETA